MILQVELVVVVVVVVGIYARGNLVQQIEIQAVVVVVVVVVVGIYARENLVQQIEIQVVVVVVVVLVKCVPLIEITCVYQKIHNHQVTIVDSVTRKNLPAVKAVV